MHELAIAQNILHTALAALGQYPPGRLKTVRLSIGRLQALEPANLRFAFRALSRGTPASGARLAIRRPPPQTRCRQCRRRGRRPGERCAACGGSLELDGGQELVLESLELVSDEPTDH